MSLFQYLGRGWAFPPAPNARGGLPLAEGAEKVAQSIRLILETEPGERIMRPSFGCGLRRYLMAPNSAATRELIRSDVEAALSSFEPRIALTGVAVEPTDDPAQVLIRLAYVHVRNGQPGNLVYPFFLQA